MAHFIKGILEVMAEQNGLANVWVTAIAKVHSDSNYDVFRKGRHAVQTLLEMTGIDLPNGASIHELFRFQEHFREYKLFAYHGLSCEDMMFEGPFDSPKRINPLYDDVEGHYHVNTNFTGDVARKYVC